jgi:hypothetical protein
MSTKGDFLMGVACVSVSVSLAGCGGSRQAPAQSAPAEAHGGTADVQSESAPAQKRKEQGGDYAPAPSTAAPSPEMESEPPAAAAPPGMPESTRSSSRASIQLSQAKRELDVATSRRDCKAACRALASMERAALQVCEIARSSEERQSCKTAEGDVADAKKRVQTACGACKTSG